MNQYSISAITPGDGRVPSMYGPQNYSSTTGEPGDSLYGQTARGRFVQSNLPQDRPLPPRTDRQPFHGTGLMAEQGKPLYAASEQVVEGGCPRCGKTQYLLSMDALLRCLKCGNTMVDQSRSPITTTLLPTPRYENDHAKLMRMADPTASPGQQGYLASLISDPHKNSNTKDRALTCHGCAGKNTRWNYDNGHTYQCLDCGATSHTGRMAKECEQCAQGASPLHQFAYM